MIAPRGLRLAALRPLLPPAALLVAVVASAGAATSQDRFWLFWEQTTPTGAACTSAGGCAGTSRLAGRRLPTNDTAALHQFFGALTAQAVYDGRPADDPEGPRLCPADVTPPVVAPAVAPDTGQQPLSAKTDALRGIMAVGLDLTAMKPPPGAGPEFGAALQSAFAEQLAAAGMSVVAPAEAARMPGQPQLKLFFSFTDPTATCQYSYSVFATLTQTALLTRDLSVKLEVGVWSYLGKGDRAAGELDMLREVVVAFLADWQLANQPGPTPSRP